jgi:hypothetical protein
MNAHTLSSRTAPGRSGPRRALAVAALAATAALVAACGSNDPPGASGSAQYQKTLAFVRCMRAHGALGVPDPTSAGTITVTQALLNNPTIQSAAHSCQKLLPRNAIQLPPALQRKLATQALQYTACMRAHGEPNFPDPIIHGDQIGFRIAAAASGPAASGAPSGQTPDASSHKSGGGGSNPPAGALAPNSPQFQAAERACQHFMPDH